MTWVDWAIVAVAAAFALAGWRTGLIAMLVWAVSVVAGIAVAGAWHGRVLVDLAFLEEPPTGWLRVAAFAVLFGAVLLAGAFAAHWARGAAKALMLGWADGAGGAVVGLAFALLAMQALAAAVVLAPVPEGAGAAGGFAGGRPDAGCGAGGAGAAAGGVRRGVLRIRRDRAGARRRAGRRGAEVMPAG